MTRESAWVRAVHYRRSIRLPATAPQVEPPTALDALLALIAIYHRDVHGWTEEPVEACTFAHCEGVLRFVAERRP